VNQNLNRWNSLIRNINDFPAPGIVFRDITPLIQDATALLEVSKALGDFDTEATQIAGIEARGFIFATGAALLSHRGFTPIRKKGKLPFSTFEESYGLEYGEDSIQIHTDALKPTDSILLIDDVLATGGTLAAAIRLIEQSGAKVKTISVLLEIESLNGRAKLFQEFPNIAVRSLLKG
jgi:adenine phosphoribosyltransferase